MTQYTVPHSLPIIEPNTDYIRSPNAGNIAKDLTALAVAVNTALSALRAVAQYDTAQGVLQAQHYSDQVKILALIQAGQVAESLTAKSLADAKTYSDATVRASGESANAYARNQDALNLGAAKDYADQILEISNISLDTDGTPYFSPGSVSPKVFADTDGTPYFREL